MASGHNFTNYVSWRLINAGMPRNVDWLHNGGDWAKDARHHGIPVDGTPSIGAVAQWRGGSPDVSWAGHVAYIVAVSDNAITIVEDNYSSGPLSVRTITKDDPHWPSNFIHFNAVGSGVPGESTALYTPGQGFPQVNLLDTLFPSLDGAKTAATTISG